MENYILASVANVELLRRENGKLKHFLYCNMLTDSALSFANSMEEIRAGKGGKLIGRFGHSSGITLQMTNAVFNNKLFEALIGAEDVSATAESHSVIAHIDTTNTPGREITLTGCAKVGSLCGMANYVAWAKKKGCDASDDIINLDVTEDGKVTLPDDGPYCISYFRNEPGALVQWINAMFKPMELVAIIDIDKYAAEASYQTSDAVIGHKIIKIPRFQFDGQFDLSLNMTSAATLSLNGTVLATSAAGDCEGKEYYAEIVDIDNADSTAEDFRVGLFDILIHPDFRKVGDTPVIYGLYKNLYPAILSNEDLKNQKVSDGKLSAFAEGALDAQGAWKTAGAVTVTVYKSTTTVEVKDKLCDAQETIES